MRNANIQQWTIVVRNMHQCAHFSYKIVFCVIWDWCSVGFVQQAYYMVNPVPDATALAVVDDRCSPIRCLIFESLMISNEKVVITKNSILSFLSVYVIIRLNTNWQWTYASSWFMLGWHIQLSMLSYVPFTLIFHGCWYLPHCQPRNPDGYEYYRSDHMRDRIYRIARRLD